jgi:septum formation protein
MALLGIPFEVHVADVDERAGHRERAPELVARLSRAKALAVAGRMPHAAVIGADTIVVLDGEILGKPASAAKAAAMLRRLRDRPHQVYSGVTLCPPEHGAPRTAVVESTVWMRPYSDAEIAAYVASGDPLDKAGAYAIQNPAFHPVARLEGCYASVMGLPLCQVAELLAQIGVVARVDVPTACAAIVLPPELEEAPCCCTERVASFVEP